MLCCTHTMCNWPCNSRCHQLQKKGDIGSVRACSASGSINVRSLPYTAASFLVQRTADQFRIGVEKNRLRTRVYKKIGYKSTLQSRLNQSKTWTSFAKIHRQSKIDAKIWPNSGFVMKSILINSEMIAISFHLLRQAYQKEALIAKIGGGTAEDWPLKNRSDTEYCM